MNRTAAIVVAALIGAGLAAGGYWLGQRSAQHDAPATAPAASTSAPAAKTDSTGRRILYWHDPMHPQQKFDKPGKSPFMNMDLVPVYADAATDEGGVAVSPRVRQSLGMRIATAEMTELRQDLAAVGNVQVDERRIARAEVRTQGWVERLHVRAVNDPVRAGQVLAEVYSPELLQAQEEYLLVRRMAKDSAENEPLARAARRRLESLGLAESGIAKLEQTGIASRRLPLVSPISGIVTELGVREGAMVQAGTPAFTLTDLSSVWLTVEVPEAQAAALKLGQDVSATVQSIPGKSFSGRIDFVYPELNTQTRTVKARLALANPGLALRPGMFAEVSLASASRKVLTVPTEAVIQTGTRIVVIVFEGERFRAATVQTGAERGGRTEVIKGLKEGEKVVASGQFLVDSEASLRGTLSRLEGGAEAAPATAPAADSAHKGLAKVIAIDAAKGRIELDHEPIATLKWPKMTMEFAVEDKAALAKLKKGDVVEFEVRGKPNPDGDFVIQRITPRSAK
jgi:Cu(I)/Ag(I) efflux system membrane fusion protein